MNKYKYIDKFYLDKFINPIFLLIKHILFFLKALITVLSENIIVNIIILSFYTYVYLHTNINDNIRYMLYGAIFSILLTLNIITAGEKYRKEIIWDGDIRIIDSENYNFEHKIDAYYMLSRNLTRIISMIITYFDRSFAWGIITSYKDFNQTAEHFSLWRYEKTIFDLDYIDEMNSYEIFSKFVNSFNEIEEVITSLQSIQRQINTFCPYEYIKASLALLLNELLIIRYHVISLRKFIPECSVDDSAERWKLKLLGLYHYKTINSSIIQNNIRNLVQNLSVMYKDINKDYNFSKRKN